MAGQGDLRALTQSQGDLGSLTQGDLGSLTQCDLGSLTPTEGDLGTQTQDDLGLLTPTLTPWNTDSLYVYDFFFSALVETIIVSSALAIVPLH